MYAIKQTQPTVAVIWDTRRKQSKKFPVKIRVYYNGIQKYYSTGKKLSASEWTKMHAKKPGELKDTLIDIQDKEKLAIKIIEGMPVFSFKDFEKRFMNYADVNKLSVAFDDYIKKLNKNNQAS